MKKILASLGLIVLLSACITTVAPPSITKVRPRFVAVGETVIITGTGFSSGTGVTIGGITATVLSSSSTELKVKNPTLEAGNYSVLLTNPDLQTAKGALGVLADSSQYFADQALVVFKDVTDQNKAALIASSNGMSLIKFVPPSATSGVCSKSLAVFGQSGGASRAVDTASDIPEVLEANPHTVDTGGAYLDSGPTNLTQHKNEFAALELDRAYTFWKSRVPTMPKRNPRVAVLDTGVSLHYDFRNLLNLTQTNLLTGRNFTTESSGAPNLETDTADLAEDSSAVKVGHGTAIAAIIGARDTEINSNFSNTFWQVGVLPAENVSASGAEILPVKVCEKNLKCQGINVLQGICYAINQKSDVINISLGTQQPSSILKSAIQAATDANIAVVASAGNAGTSPNYPAALSLELPIIAVGSLKYINSSNKYAASGFTVPGDWVTVSAPGETQSASFDPSGTDGFGYRSFEGTSFAAAWVSGVAAMLKSAYPSLTPLEIQNKIKATASSRDLTTCDPKFCGAGMVNAAVALGAP